MDPNQIARMLASGDKAQVIAAQKQLQAMGYNIGPRGADGSLGKATSDAVSAFTRDFQAQQALQQQQSERENQLKAKELETRNAEARARETQLAAEREAAERAPGRQAMEFGKFVAPIGAGMYLGHRSAEGIEGRISQMSPEMQRNMSVARRSAPYIAKSMTRFLPEAGVAFAGAEALRDSNPVLSEVSQAVGTGLLSAGLLNIGEGVTKSLTPPDVPGGPSLPPSPSGPQLPPASRPVLDLTPMPSGGPSLPAPSTPPTAPPAPQQLPNADRLRAAYEAATGKKAPKAKKEAHYNMMKKALTAENQAAVAEALGLPGSASRKTVLQHARDIMKLGGRSSIVLPFAVGSYFAATGDSEAADASTGERVGNAAAEFGIGAGGTYAGMKGMEALSRAAPNFMGALGAAGGAMTPFAAADLSDTMSREDLNTGQNWMARNMPFTRHLPGSSIGKAYDMAQVPAANPERRSMGPRLPEGADQEVASAWRKSPRRTVIELSRSSGLDPNDIAMLAGVSPQEVVSVMSEIPSQALNRAPMAMAAR